MNGNVSTRSSASEDTGRLAEQSGGGSHTAKAMRVPTYWARSDDEVAQVREAKQRGDLCAACGRDLLDGEAVYYQRIAVGTEYAYPGAPVRPWSYPHAPVGVEFAAPELLEHAETDAPEWCEHCGRRVVYATSPPGRQHVTCSQRCRGHVRQALHPKPRRPRSPRPARPTPAAKSRTPPPEHWNERLRRLREAGGMSREELAAACSRRRLPLSPDDIRRYEEVGRMPSVATFALLARALHITIEVLYWGEDEAARIAEERANTAS